MQFSRTPFRRGATDRRWVRLKQSTRAECAHLRRTIMLRKVALRLVAPATLSAMALAPSAASAHGWGWGGGFGGYHHHFGPGFGGYIGGGGRCCWSPGG